MEIKEKIKKYYEGIGIKVDDEYVKDILANEQRKNNIIRLYKQEEINSMNYILGKPEDNNYFTKSELEIVSKINLFNRKVVEWCKLIWSNKDNEENLNEISNALKERRCPKCI